MGRTSKLLNVCVIVVASLFLLCPEKSAMAKKEQPIPLGLCTWTEGPALRDGRAFTRAFKTGIKYVNEHGGILGGRQIVGFIESQGMTGETAKGAAMKLVMKENVKALIGPHWAITIPAGYAVAKKYNLPYSPDYGALWLHRQNYPGTFCLSANVGSRTFGQMRWMEKKGYKNVVLIFSNITYNHDVENAIKSKWGKSDSPVKINPIIWYNFGQTELTKEAIKALSYNPDFIWSEGWSASAEVALMKTLREQGYKGDLSVTAVLNKEIMDMVPKEVSEGVFSNMEFCPDPSIPANKEFCDYWQKEWGPGELPYRGESTIWAQVVFLLKAMDKAGTAGDGTKDGLMKIHDAIYDLQWRHPGGEVIHMKNGKGMYFKNPMVVIKDGKLTVSEYMPTTEKDWHWDPHKK